MKYAAKFKKRKKDPVLDGEFTMAIQALRDYANEFYPQ
jgi:hypothetical protein